MNSIHFHFNGDVNINLSIPMFFIGIQIPISCLQIQI